MQGRMSSREKNSSLPSQPAFAPLGQAVLETFGEGVAVFDPYGRMLYANQRARRVIEGLGDGAAGHGDHLRERLMAFGGRTLAERERQAILDTLEVTHGKLAETARRLGISRTTLWRRLRAYGLRPNGQADHASGVRA